MFVYCKKCGLIVNEKNKTAICRACEIPMFSVPEEFLTTSGFMFSSQQKRKEFEELIKHGKDYSEQANAEKDVIIEQKNAALVEEISRKVDEYNKSRVKFTCPICHSEMISKISNVGKFVKVSALGILGAGDIGKKYKCNSCGYRF